MSDDDDTWYSDLLAIVALILLAAVVRVIELVDPTWLTTERTRDNEGRNEVDNDVISTQGQLADSSRP